MSEKSFSSRSSSANREPEDSELWGPASEAELNWIRQPMVRWFDPRQLLQTGLRAGLSRLFGEYADRRELQAALARSGVPEGKDAKPSSPAYRYGEREELWLDYTADLGDGFRPTYTQAWLLSRPELEIEGLRADEEEQIPTERGDVLVLGGDQVYPSASRSAYQNRFAGPYRAAFPWCLAEPVPELFAIPGNHDWYDGLSSFLRLFCQQRWIGGWKTRQSRSYFALELPHQWWLLALDVQLGADIDQPQIEYFREVARDMEDGDRVVLCCAEPLWLKDEGDEQAYEPLAFVERNILPSGVEVSLLLAGDLHHYARYADRDSGRQRCTCGGGGAYLSGTQRLPNAVSLPRPDAPEPARRSDEDVETSEKQAAYPDAQTSIALRWGVLALPWKNPGYVWAVGILYVLYAWFLQSHPLPPEGSFMETVDDLGLADAGTVVRSWWSIVAHAPGIMLCSVGIVLATWAFAAPDEGRPRWLRHGVGPLHGVLHLVLVVGLTWGIARVHLGVLDWNPGDLMQFVLFGVEMVFLGGPLGGVLTGLAMLPGVNLEYAFSAQHREGYKSFLRLHLDASGTLTVYPVGIEEPGQWRFVSGAAPETARYEPEDEPPRPELIEAPIRIPGAASRGGGADRGTAMSDQ